MEIQQFPACCGAYFISDLYDYESDNYDDEWGDAPLYRAAKFKKEIKQFIKIYRNNMAFYMLITTEKQNKCYSNALIALGFQRKANGINGRHNTRLNLWVKTNKEFKVD